MEHRIDVYLLASAMFHGRCSLILLEDRACLGFCVNAFSQKRPSRWLPNPIIKRLIAIRKSLNGIVHFWDADWIASYTTFFTESSVGNTLRFLILWWITLFCDSMAIVV